MLVPQRYSERLGLIEPDQLRDAAALAGIGDVRDAYPGPGGPFGQNVVIETSDGSFVLRGNPHGHDQLTKERRVAAFVAERSSLPVPWPYEVHEDTEIFGWTFAVVPYLPGEPGADLWGPADDDARIDLAAATGEALAWLHEAEADFFGPYDAQLDDFVEMDDFSEWFLRRLDHWRRRCRAVNALSMDAEQYIDDLIESSVDALDEPFNPVLVHHDFHVENLSFVPDGDGGFEAAGVFDLGSAVLGDGEQDLVRMLRFLHEDAEREAFVDAYTSEIPLGDDAADRLGLYALADALVFWEFARRVGAYVDEEASFVGTMRPLVERARSYGARA